jgi:PKD repeat protein
VHQVRIDELPTAKLALATKHPRAKKPVSFSGQHSRDPDGGIRTYLWRFGDGSGKTGAKVRHTYKHAGRYTVTLTVADRSGLLAAVKHQIHVSQAR